MAPVSRIVPVAITALAVCICTLAGGVAYAMCYLQPDLRQQYCLNMRKLPSSRGTTSQSHGCLCLHIGSFSLCIPSESGQQLPLLKTAIGQHRPRYFQHQRFSPAWSARFCGQSLPGPSCSPAPNTSHPVTQPQLPTKKGFGAARLLRIQTACAGTT